MKNKILYSLILLGYIITGCNEPENNGFSDINLENNTDLNIDTTYISGTDVFIQDLYNGSILNYSLNDIQYHSIFVNNLKYNLTATALNSEKKCFLYNGVRYFESIVAEPLIYCDDKINFEVPDNQIPFSSYTMNLIYSDVLLPINTDVFDGFYFEYGANNEISVVGFPITLSTSVNDSVFTFMNYIKSNEIIENIEISTNPAFSLDTNYLTSQIKISTKMKIGSMSLLNIVSKEIMDNTGLTLPSTFLTSSNGRVSDSFQLKINYKIIKDDNGINIGYVVILSVFANDISDTSNLTPEEAIDKINLENENISHWNDLTAPINII